MQRVIVNAAKLGTTAENVRVTGVGADVLVAWWQSSYHLMRV